MQHAGQMAVVVLILALAAGCSGRSPAPPGASSSASSGPEARKTCGTSYTAAHVLVEVQVPAGAVDCAVALRVEADYTRELAGRGSAGKWRRRDNACRWLDLPGVPHPADLADRAGIGVPSGRPRVLRRPASPEGLSDSLNASAAA